MRRAIAGSRLTSVAILLFGCGLLAASITGCSDDKKTNPPPDSHYLAATSPENLLANLKTAYEERNLGEYTKLFHEDFEFVFNPEDVQNPWNPTPSTWARTEELLSAQSIFADSLVERIQLTFNQGDPEEWTEFAPGGLKVRMDGVFLTVTTRNSEGEPLYLVVQGATHWFYFLQDSGSSTWRIRRWEDSPIGGKGADATWGEIKFRYYTHG